MNKPKSKKVEIIIEPWEATQKRLLEMAERWDRGDVTPQPKRITFESFGHMLQVLTARRVALIEETRKKPLSITDLANSVGRHPRAVKRDLDALIEAGLMELRDEPNPGHGRVKVAHMTVEKIDLHATL